jgi:hypothetical protein
MLRSQLRLRNIQSRQRNIQSRLRNIPEEQWSYLHGGGSLKPNDDSFINEKIIT